MKVREIMTGGPVTVRADATVREAAALLRKHDVGGLPVMDGEELVGVITEADVLSLLKTGELSEDLWLPSPLEFIEVPIREMINWERTRAALSDIGKTPVRRVMSMPPVTIGPDAGIEEAAGLMLREGIARLPVVEEGRLIGIIARRDIVQGLGVSYEESEES
ncbi:CBS domain-containing protein [Methanofollis aquaemaris]|uniref:CBS domain-containing protein n=1 Tax=Methanofollis aquaemaris TaxID=126734 RepID=A0A8A3S8Q4_9EURY|nr:CBS domain-containing protein [Methanofollis aquaemaris]QSZ68402.1 CBS domain-containing protein [Methanofollis aquaemaris]